jgi:hypothetical protein
MRARGLNQTIRHDIRLETPTKSLRLKGGPARDILSSSWILLMRSLGTGVPVDSLSSTRLLEKLAAPASFVNGEGIAKGGEG